MSLLKDDQLRKHARAWRQRWRVLYSCTSCVGLRSLLEQSRLTAPSRMAAALSYGCSTIVWLHQSPYACMVVGMVIDALLDESVILIYPWAS